MGSIEFERFEETIELPCIMDNHLLSAYAPFPLVPSMFDVVKKLDVDIVSVSEHISSATWMFAVRKKKWKTVLTEHGNCWKSPRDKIYNLLTKKVLIPRLDGFVGIALKSKVFLESLGARRVKVIPNPIDCNLFRPIVRYSERENIVLFAGRVDTSRRLHLLIKAMQNVSRKVDNVKLWIVGARGNLSEYLKKEKNIGYLGAKAHVEMPMYYNKAKVLVNTVAGAGCGCITSEALACGTPIVGIEDLDFPFAWKNGECGYLTKNNSENLADAIIKLLLDEKQVHKNCRGIALREFSYEVVGKKYQEVFEKIEN